MKTLALLAFLLTIVTQFALTRPASAEPIVTGRDCTIKFRVSRNWAGGPEDSALFAKDNLTGRLEALGYRVVDRLDDAEFSLNIRFDRGCVMRDREPGPLVGWIDNIIDGYLSYPTAYGVELRQTGNSTVLSGGSGGTDHPLRAKRAIRRMLRDLPSCKLI
jgi:hypothetical protein